MKCFFKRHKFKHLYDSILGGIIARHLYCKKCSVKYTLLWHVDKPHKPLYKTIRVKENDFICR